MAVYFLLVLICCFIKVHALSNGDLRLVDGNNYKEGRVEMYYNSEWGTVCDHDWSPSNAKVVCKQLGFGAYGTTLTGSSVPDGSGNIWLDNLRCVGTETQILDCPSNTIGDHNCAHSEDVGVSCYGIPPDYSIRLVSGPGLEHYEGRVEVYHGGEWKSVCDDRWGWEESDVVCKSLNYSLGAQRFYHGAHYGRGFGEILLDDVNCTGSENSLLYCKHRGVHIHNCAHSEDIGVKCAVRSYITNITVIAGSLSSISCPPGYTKHYYNLNYGDGGNFVYLCYKKGVRDAPITGLNVIAGTSTNFPIQSGYTKVNVDIKSGIGTFLRDIYLHDNPFQRDSIYLIYTKNASLPPIMNVSVYGGTTPYVYPPSTWVRIDTDCNQNAGGRYIYICYYQPRD